MINFLIEAHGLLKRNSKTFERSPGFAKLCTQLEKDIDKWFREQAEQKGAELLPENFSVNSYITGVIYNRGYRLSSAELEEVKAEIYSYLPRTLERFDPDRGALTTFLRRLIIWCTQDFLKAKKRKQELPEESLEEYDEEPLEAVFEPIEMQMSKVEFDELVKDIHDYLGELKPSMQVRVFDKAMLEHKPHKEIRDELNISGPYFSMLLRKIQDAIAAFARENDLELLESSAKAVFSNRSIISNLEVLSEELTCKCPPF